MDDQGARSCENCGTRRLGPYCHVCGQHEDTAHHSVRRLCMEAAEQLFNTNGKTFRTLRGILLRPAELTKSYLAGKRAAQLPPLQLYFITLVLFLFIADQEVRVEMPAPTPAQIAEIPHWIAWAYPLGQRIRAHGSSFVDLLRQSAEFFGLLMVPVAALLLWGLYAGRQRRLYDHLIFALHSLSFLLIMLGIDLLLGDGPDIILLPPLVLVCVHLFFHLRGCHGGGALATMARMALLLLGTLIAYIALSVVWMATAYFAMGM